MFRLKALENHTYGFRNFHEKEDWNIGSRSVHVILHCLKLLFHANLLLLP